jgi:hypothetical protein
MRKREGDANVLTLAEELGLGGYHLASRVRKAFRRLAQS